jgi:hypothetical protein
MKFRSSVFIPFDDKEIYFPHIQYDETLHFEGEEFFDLEIFLRELMTAIAKWIFEVSQQNPELMDKYKQPKDKI